MMASRSDIPLEAPLVLSHSGLPRAQRTEPSVTSLKPRTWVVMR